MFSVVCTIANLALRITEIGFFFVIIGNNQIDSKSGFNIFPDLFFHNRVLTTNIERNETTTTVSSPNLSNNLIRDWIYSTTNNTNQSQHWWYASLPDTIKTSFDTIIHNQKIKKMFHSLFHSSQYMIDVLPEMNELYVTGAERENENVNSDRVFYTPHLDGPFYWIPFVSVYRCIIGLNENNKIMTHFPNSDIRKRVNTGDVLAFDFNREIHYIYDQTLKDSTDIFDVRRNASDIPRITIKSHYCIYPKHMASFGKRICHLNVKYDQAFRNLFLKTIKPETTWEKIFGTIVLSGTNIYAWLDILFGYKNIIYLGFLQYLLFKERINALFYLQMMLIPFCYKILYCFLFTDALKTNITEYVNNCTLYYTALVLQYILD